MATNQNVTAAMPAKSNAVTAFEAIVKSDYIDRQLASALADNKGAFISSLVELYTGDKSLQACNPKLVALEAVKAASLNLPINKALGFAYIVVYNNNVKERDPETGRDVWRKVPTPTFIPGYKGYIQLAMRTGQYRTINADVVYEGELMKTNRLSGEISLNGERKSDKVVGYFCYFELLNGYSKTLFMSVEEMAKYAMKYSPSIPRDAKGEDLVKLANTEPSAKKVGWMGNFNDMAIKTVIRRVISKYGYMSIKMQSALTSDIRADEQITATERNDMIAEAGHETVDVADASYEEVDVETGEVKAAVESKPEPKKAPAEPNY